MLGAAPRPGSAAGGRAQQRAGPQQRQHTRAAITTAPTTTAVTGDTSAVSVHTRRDATGRPHHGGGVGHALHVPHQVVPALPAALRRSGDWRPPRRPRRCGAIGRRPARRRARTARSTPTLEVLGPVLLLHPAPWVVVGVPVARARARAGRRRGSGRRAGGRDLAGRLGRPRRPGRAEAERPPGWTWGRWPGGRPPGPG